MPKYTKEDIMRLIDEEDVKFIRLQFTDIFGILKNVAITPSQMRKALNNECMFDGSSIDGFARISESDMYLYPDIDTFEIYPWRPQSGKVARMFCNVYTLDRKPFEGDPRNVLRRVLDDAQKMGICFKVDPELEFFLFQSMSDGRRLPADRAGYFDLASDTGVRVREEIVRYLNAMNVSVDASHHEIAPGQHEIDLPLMPAALAAVNTPPPEPPAAW